MTKVRVAVTTMVEVDVTAHTRLFESSGTLEERTADAQEFLRTVLATNAEAAATALHNAGLGWFTVQSVAVVPSAALS